mgnify:FL=1
MKIDGRAIAEQILNDLSIRVLRLKTQGVTPTLAVIQVGDDPGSTAYIRQKQKAAETIRAVLKHDKLPMHTTVQHVNTLIHTYNADPAIHGLIVQQPLPGTLERAGAALANIILQKDVDGFIPNSPFQVPVALAVQKILEEIFHHSSFIIHHSTNKTKKNRNGHFTQWLKTQHIVVIGRGETAGKPIAEALSKQGCKVTVVHSRTREPDDAIRSADILISCVGKSHVVTKNNLKPGALLIGVGIWRDDEGRLHGDYEEDDVKDIVAAYTPTPGGVGPVNVACLMQNLVQACILQMGQSA